MKSGYIQYSPACGQVETIKKTGTESPKDPEKIMGPVKERGTFRIRYNKKAIN